MKEWKLVLDEEAFNTLLHSRGNERRELLRLLEQLKLEPYRAGDWVEPDDTGRLLQVHQTQHFVIACWPDTFVKELRVVDIARRRKR